MTIPLRIYKALFNTQADCPKTKGYALFAEASKDKPNVRKMLRLIDKGADVNVLNADQATILIYVAGRKQFNNEDALMLGTRLLEAGAKVNQASISGNTAAIWAARLKRDDLAAYLIKNGANAYAANDKGQTAALIAEHSIGMPYELKKTLASLTPENKTPRPSAP